MSYYAAWTNFCPTSKDSGVSFGISFPCLGPKLTEKRKKKKSQLARLFQWHTEFYDGRNSMNNNRTRHPVQPPREFSLITRKFCLVTVLSLSINCFGSLFSSTSLKPFGYPRIHSWGFHGSSSWAIPGLPGSSGPEPSFRDHTCSSRTFRLHGAE